MDEDHKHRMESNHHMHYYCVILMCQAWELKLWLLEFVDRVSRWSGIMEIGWADMHVHMRAGSFLGENACT